MGSNNANLSKRLVRQGITGLTALAFLVSQIAWPLSVSAHNTLRQEPPPENKSGLEELTQELQSVSQPATISIANTGKASQSPPIGTLRTLTPVTPLGMAGVSASVSYEDEEEQEIRYSIRRFEVNYGFLPQEHEAAKFLQERLAGLLPDVSPEDRPKVKVLAATGEGINAAVFPEGTIIVNPELLQAIEYEEKLDFVLLHEINHWYRKHFQAMKETVRRGSPIKDVVLRSLGLARYHEEEADVAAFFQLMERERSGLGAIQFLEQLDAEQKKDHRKRPDWDPAHGTLRDRILNLKSLIQLVNMHYLDVPMTSAPPILKTSTTGLPKGGRLDYLLKPPPFDPKRRTQWEAEFDQAVGNLPPDVRRELLQEAIPAVDYRLENLKLAVERKGSGQKPQPGVPIEAQRPKYVLQQNLITLVGKLVSWWEKTLPQHFQGVSAQTRTIRQTALAEGALGLFLFTGYPIPRQRGPEEEEGIWKSSGYPGLADEFEKLLAQSETVEELNRFFQALDVPIQQSRILCFVSQVGLAMLKPDAAFRTKRGSVRAEDYLRKFAKALASLQAALARREVLPELRLAALTVADTWSDLIFWGARSLLDAEEWEGKKDRYAQLTAKLSVQYGFTLSLPVLASHIEELRLKDKKEAELLENWLLSLSPDFTVRQGHLRRLGEIFTALTTKIPRENQRPNNPQYRSLLLEAADHLNALPEVVDLPSVHWAITGYTPSSFWKTTTRTELKHTYLEWLIGEFSHGQVAQELSLSEFRFLFGWVASVAENEETYQECTNSISTHIGWLKSVEKQATLQELGDLADLVKGPSQAAAFVGKSTSLKSEDVQEVRLERNNHWVDSTNRILLRQLEQATDRAAFFHTVDIFLQRWPAQGSPEVVRIGMKHLDLAPQQLNLDTYRILFCCSFFMTDPMIRRQLQEYVLLQLVESNSVPFSEALDLALHRYRPQGTSGGFRTFKTFMEKAKTYPDFEKLKQEGRDLLAAIRGATQTGVAVLAEGGIEIEKGFGATDRAYFLRQLLASSANDRELRSYMAGYWKTAYKRTVEESIERDWAQHRELPEDWPLQRPVSGRIELPFDTLMEHLYRMGDVERYILLRKLISGEQGALSTTEERVRLLESFLNRYLRANGEEAAAGVIRQVLQAVFEMMPADELYLLLYPLLLERIANPPSEPGIDTWELMGAKEWAHRMVLGWAKNEGYKGRRREKFVKELRPQVRKKLSWFFTGAARGEPRPDTVLEEQVFQVVPPSFYQNEVGPMSPLDLVVETARQLGAPGVRFLQLLGQTVDLPQVYRDKFLTVYDDIEGQSPLSLSETIKDRLPEYASRIQRFVRRLGGGSLYTVYLVEVVATEEEYPGQGGQVVQEVVKVLNPNALYRARKSVQVIQDALTKLAKEQPESRYSQALPLVDILWEWIEKDVRDEAFEGDDVRFREAWNGWSVPQAGARVIVPRSIPTGTPTVRREEYMAGETFTSLSDFHPDKQKELVALGVQFYMAQITSSILQVLMGQTDRTLILSD